MENKPRTVLVVDDDALNRKLLGTPSANSRLILRPIHWSACNFGQRIPYYSASLKLHKG